MSFKSLLFYSGIGILLLTFNIYFQINFLDLNGYKIYIYVLALFIYIICIMYLIIEPLNSPNLRFDSNLIKYELELVIK